MNDTQKNPVENAGSKNDTQKNPVENAGSKKSPGWLTGDEANQMHTLGMTCRFRVHCDFLPIGGQKIEKGAEFRATFNTDLARMVKRGDLSMKGADQ